MQTLQPITRFFRHFFLFSLIFAAGIFSVCQAWGQGIAFRGAGAVNESMGGASTACPLSATGALYWNPATMSAFHGTVVDVDLGIALPSSSISSTLPNDLGGGTTDSESGAVPLPNVSFIRHLDESPWAFGFYFGAIGGSKTNFPEASLTENPLLSKSDYGYGNLNSSVQIFQIGANMSYSFSDKFSMSFGPSLIMADLNCDPLYVVDGYGAPGAAIRGTGNRFVFGGGFQVGFFYDTQAGWRFGLNYKSQNWLEPLRFQAEGGKELSLHLDYPAILSFGASWYGWEKWTFAWDFRYFFHENAGFDALGWHDMFAFAMGVQREITDRWSWRVGYSMNENQLDGSFSRANIATPLVPRHAFFTGTSFRVDEHMTFSITYGHIFKATSSGCYFGEGREALGGNVSIASEADEVVAGVSFNF